MLDNPQPITIKEEILITCSAWPCKDLGSCQDGDWASQQQGQAARKHAALEEEEISQTTGETGWADNRQSSGTIWLCDSQTGSSNLECALVGA